MFVYEKYVKPYQQSVKGRFMRQQANAKARGIDWELTFEDWWKIWDESGKWDQRGREADSYCMSRRQDIGPYSKDNVVIKRVADNSQESHDHSLKEYKPVGRPKRVVIWEHLEKKYPPIVLDWKHPYPLEAYPNGYIF